MKKKLLIFSKLLISASIIGFIFSKIDLEQLWLIILSVDLQKLIIATLIIFATICFGTLRWQILLTAQNFTFSFSELLRLTLIGLFFNNFLLGTNGGDLVKAFYIGKVAANNKASAIMTIFIDRLLGFFSFLAVATMMIFINFSNPQLRNLLRFIGVCYIFVFIFLIAFYNLEKTKKFFPVVFLMRFAPVKKIIGELYEAVALYHDRKTALVWSFFMSLVAQFFLISAIFMLGISLNIREVRFGDYLTLVPVIQTISSVPVSFSGLGISEGAYAYFFMPLGVAFEKSVALSFLSRVFGLVWGLVGAIVYAGSSVKAVQKTTAV